MDNVVNDLTVHQTLANGNAILIFYDIFVLCLFLFEVFLYINREHYKALLRKNMEAGTRIRPVRRYLLKLTRYYDRHGLLTVNALLLIISVIAISMSHMVTVREILGLVATFIVFIVIMYFVQKLFVGLDQFEDDMVSRYVDVIFYLLLGHSFVYFASFVSRPSLLLTFIGLLFALFLCFSVMIRAIINPNILMKPTNERRRNREAFGIIKGMGALMGCELGILYLMIYSCWKTNPFFFQHATERPLDYLDLLYYLFVSFSTIGYGDIFPVRVEGMFYSQFTAIVISVTSIFSTACFVGAIISGAYSIGQQNREKQAREEDAQEKQIDQTIKKEEES